MECESDGGWRVCECMLPSLIFFFFFGFNGTSSCVGMSECSSIEDFMCNLWVDGESQKKEKKMEVCV